ncbi:MAG: hypothetical protein M3Y08_16125 [Fibrobacterota bacterium]|nr:hypothetical protein [Fibrobacterota bacterium]
MPIQSGNIKAKLQKPTDFIKIGWILCALTIAPWAQGTQVEYQGRVVDSKGAGVAGATVKLVESALTDVTDAKGDFTLQGIVAIGVIKKTVLPGNLRLAYRDGILKLEYPGSRAPRVEWISPDGSRHALPVAIAKGSFKANLDQLAGRSSGTHWVRIISDAGIATFRFVRLGKRSHGVLLGGPASPQAPSPSRSQSRLSAKIGSATGFVLEISAPGFLQKRFAQSGPTLSGLSLALLPDGATLKERIQNFIGEGNTLRLAYLKPVAVNSRKFILHYSDLEEMAGDTLPQHAFADSEGPASSPYGAYGPSWSPDGGTIAYEIGWENLTTSTSRVYFQPITGQRRNGPAYPSTNPRWWTDGKDTAIVWCTSGREDAWADTATATYRQKVVGGVLVEKPELLSKGSYNAGLSPDGRYLATAYRYGLMQDLVSGQKRSLHVYPGHPKAPDGSSTDSLQACNGSVSQDPAHPSRMLFLDFGVPDEPAYANVVTPKLYAQHRMILIGDFASDAPGRIVDFIDTPASELEAENTWDDPEWTNAADYAVATLRDPDGDKSVPSEPKPTQPDIYLIKLSTKETIRVLSGGHQVLPAAWIGPK